MVQIAKEFWRPSPRSLLLAADTVHIWSIPLDQPAAQRGSLAMLLSPDERARADRLRGMMERDRFIVGRGALRSILSQYVGQDAQALTFRYAERGKPALAGQDLAFNLTHSDGLALCAVGCQGPIGVDVERLRSIPDAQAIAAAFFSAPERADLRLLSPQDRDAGFLRCWVRKEAYVKALGHGLTASLKSFAVTLLPGDPPKLYWDEQQAGTPRGWTLFHLAPSLEHVGALAVPDGVRWVRGWQWKAEK